jgi:hypothetical protein
MTEHRAPHKCGLRTSDLTRANGYPASYFSKCASPTPQKVPMA